MFVRDAQAQTEAVPAGEAPVVTDGAPPPTGEAILVEEHETGGFPPLESEFFASQILWLALTFGLLYFVMSRTLVPRIAGIIENRRDRIAMDLDAAERMRGDADEAQAAYEQDLLEARERSSKIALGARETARSEADAERKRNEAELDNRLEEAQVRIGDIKTKALADVDAIAEETAEAILAALTGLTVSRDEVAKAVHSVASRQENRDA